ncbi:hypothetical protein, partial [Legionella sp.]|uniref:hypothetical protein n=1 Tax=Legionella sp. TaxID=459 RepID=UPI003CA1AD87
MSKWDRIYSNSINISRANTGSANLEADWHRESNQERMTINGVAIGYYAKQYNQFASLNDVELFFEDILLKDMKPLEHEKKEKIIAFLKGRFHQGGFMYPVSSPLAVGMKEYSKADKKEIPFATVGEMDITINIVTTKNGFKIQEFANIKNIVVLSQDFCKEYGIDMG